MSNGSRAPAERRVHSTRFSGGSRDACRLHTRSAFWIGGVQSTRFLGFSAFPDSASLLIGNKAFRKLGTKNPVPARTGTGSMFFSVNGRPEDYSSIPATSRIRIVRSASLKSSRSSFQRFIPMVMARILMGRSIFLSPPQLTHWSLTGPGL